MPKRLLSLLLGIALAASLTGCPTPDPGEEPSAPESAATSESGAADTSSGDGEPTIFVTDMTSRAVELQGPVTRAVALTAADAEIICALGAGETLVGRGEYCDYPPELLELPAVQSGADLNLEQILALDPQVVFMGSMAQTTDQVATLENAGLTVVNSDAQSLQGVYEAISMIGHVYDRQEEAKALVAEMEEQFLILRSSVPDSEETPIVYFEVSPLEYGLWAAGSGTFMDEIAGELGLQNAFPDVSGWGEVSQEQVIERDPDIIVTVTMYYGEGPRPEEEIAARPGWQDIAAVKENRILLLDSDKITRPGPRLAEAAEDLFRLVYGVAR